MKDLGPINKFLGTNCSQDKDGNITLKMTDYITKATDAMDNESKKPTYNPMSGGKDYFDITSPPVQSIKAYQSIIGQLLFIANAGRPDVAFPVSFLSRFLKDPREVHMDAATRIMRYLYTTREYGIKYRSKSKRQLTVYTDASQGAAWDMPFSTSGYATFLAGGAITWCSRRIRSTICLSSTEAEYIAASEAVLETMWLYNLLEHMGYPLSENLLMIDNEPAIKLASHPILHSRTKHIKLRYHKIREAVDDGIVKIEYVNTLDQVADILTKALPQKQFNYLRDKLVSMC
ncbi:uncharacterized protein NDAI_0D01220 [Naumovozyma dairenensis CBS 421]|uniref:Reverse transcriptase Ty1/copia-type domain-containing protein n=1 Tax=Naumovozyma dairenensis (strain ATCC 10597 / BCRC 20456 / CBS 421 / NBRC 0211 / NRRL Y-12639) TaxID=1071378 RepID=G0W9H5_NAUDC|nr:hypothetical protein NDAI_0D01220 [Naumovozyma dairenensis CBS 421]CCD24436.1 hypothetical protein NDAI_0D01220 [Naumovozyma dairenensis CBS 421]